MTHHRPSKKTHASAPHARSAAPKRIQNTSDSKGWLAPALLGTAAALGAAALYTAKKTREAERKHPPVGRFLDVDGVRLHYIERGHGEPLVLIHGNGTLIQDFRSAASWTNCPNATASSCSTGPATATASGRAACGRHGLMRRCSSRRSRSLACSRPSCSGIPGARWWRSRSRCKRRRSCAASSCSRATTSRPRGPTWS